MGRASQNATTRDRVGARSRAALSLGAFALGLALGLHAPWAPVGVWFVGALVASAAALLSRGVWCKGALLLAVLLLGAGWMQARAHTLAPTHISRLWGEPEPRIVQLEGVVRSPLVRRAGPPGELDPPRPGESVGWVTLDLTRGVSAGAWIPVSGRVSLSAPGLRDEHLRAGQTVRVTGRLTPRANTGADTWALARSRIASNAARLTVPDPALIERVQSATMLARARERVRTFRGELRRRAVRALGGDAEHVSDARALMLALLLGEREGGIDEIGESFRRIGAAHLLAISGFHLSVLALLVIWSTRLTGERERLAATLSLALLLIYLLILPARIPIARAGAMLLALLAADALARRHDRLALLAWIAIALLVWRPDGIAGLGFLLSVGVTALLLWLSGTRHPWIYGRPALRGVLARPVHPLRLALRASRGALVVCLLCWLLATPVIVSKTGLIAPIGALASFLLTPVVMLDLGIGFAVALAGVVWPGGAQALGVVGEQAGEVTLALVRALEVVPGASSAAPRLSGIWAAAATLWLVALVRAGARAGGLRSARLVCAGAILLLWVSLLIASAGDLRRGVVARVDMIDVGDGSCLLVRAREGALLWDAGSLSRRWGERQIRQRLGELGVWRVRTAIISHPNLDHYNALPELAEPLGIRGVLVGDATLERAKRDPRSPIAIALRELRARGVRIERLGAGDTIAMGELTLRVLGDGWADSSLADNNRSLVVRVEAPTLAGTRRALLTGDIERDAIERLARTGVDVRASVLELPHHGSVSEAALGMVGASGARVVMQSTGPSRGSDPRWSSAREGRAWLETPAMGSVWAEIRADGSIAAGGG